MTDLRARFHRADRLQPPDLWSEVMERGTVLAPTPTWQRGTARNLRLVLLVVLLAVLAVAAVATLGALLRIPHPPASGWIAYTRGDEWHRATGDIYLTSVDGTHRLIAGSEGDDLEQRCPTFSPDGRYLAYGEMGGEGPNPAVLRPAEVVVVEIDAVGTVSERRRLPAGRMTRLPCPLWSPDGSAIAYVGRQDGPDLLQVAPRDDGVVVLGAYGVEFAWTPDSAAIAVLDAPGGIRIVPVDGSEPRVLDWDLSRGAESLSLSPTRPLAAVADNDGAYIRLLNYETGLVLFEERSVEVGYGKGIPAWSPDGNRIAWSSADEIFVLRIGEASATVQRGPWVMAGTTATATVATGVAWSPDGTRLLFLGYSREILQGKYKYGYAFVSIAADGPADPLVLTPWTEELEWQRETDITWQARGN